MLASQTPTDGSTSSVAVYAVSTSSMIGARWRIENSDASSTLAPGSSHEERDSCATDEVAVADPLAKRFLNRCREPTDLGARPRWEVAASNFGCAHLAVEDVPVWVSYSTQSRNVEHAAGPRTRRRPRPEATRCTNQLSSPNPDENAAANALRICPG